MERDLEGEGGEKKKRKRKRKRKREKERKKRERRENEELSSNDGCPFVFGTSGVFFRYQHGISCIDR